MSQRTPPQKMTLYSSTNCPWAARSLIALAEANVQYETVEIDLDNKPEFFLKEVNPQGKVPTLDYAGEKLIESGPIAEFVADLFPDVGLWPQGSTEETALFKLRARIFVETFITKVVPNWAGILFRADPAAPAAILSAVEGFVEPLLPETSSAGPFFAGRTEFSMAEVLTAPFAARIDLMGRNGIVPADVYEKLQKLPRFGRWMKAVMERKSIKDTFDEASNLAKIKKKMALAQEKK
ncbi:thioredoxin-like protein [Saitoella complicata NRRL Y-17804]|nr:thioredoxin-like protein [Saitoella complicata NRRL Y-17804]ODQ55710.1 thioredoxin-like protein [Saitoella complicata NRRL Y-17804]